MKRQTSTTPFYTLSRHVGVLLAGDLSAVGKIHAVIGGAAADIAPLRVIFGESLRHIEPGPDSVAIIAAVRAAAGGVQIGSITILSALESTEHPAELISTVAELARVENARIVICAPNGARLDVGLKLALGCAGDLIRSRPRNEFDDVGLTAMLEAAGLKTLATNNVSRTPLPISELVEHVALSEATEIGRLLRSLGDLANPFAHTAYFVRECAFDSATAAHVPREEVRPRPFLSIVVRTQGTRPHTLSETLLSLVGQSRTDFEVLVLGHKLDETKAAETKKLIEEFPPWFSEKVRYTAVDDGGRSKPLNDGFVHALGEYVCFLDDDDIVFSNYVETFFDLAQHFPGRVLRSIAVNQDSENVEINCATGLAAFGPFDRPYMQTFDLFVHLRFNQSPFMTLAFPRGAFHHLNFRFDENLTTTEDWDFLLRVASLLGVANSPVITSIYRMWRTSSSSRTLHKQDEWDQNRFRVYAKLDEAFVLFPPKTTERIRYLLNSYDECYKLRSANFPLAVQTAQAVVSTYKQKLHKAQERRSILSLFGKKGAVEDCSDAELVAASGLFNATWYLEQNDDVRALGVDPLTHYIKHGGFEGRAASPTFNGAAYLKLHPDVASAGFNPLVHYVRFGAFEGRQVERNERSGAARSGQNDNRCTT